MFLKVSRTSPRYKYVPDSDFSLEKVKIKIELVVKYNLWKYANNEEQSQPEKNSDFQKYPFKVCRHCQ